MPEDIITVSGRNYEITPIGIRWTGPMTADEGARLGVLLYDITEALPWCVGDWANEMDTRFGEEAAQIMSYANWSLSTLRVYRWVASRVPPENRIPGVSFGVHQLVAKKPVPEQRALLDTALAESWTVTTAKQQIREREGAGGPVWWALIQCADQEDAQAMVDQAIIEGRGGKVVSR
jgi:hypothetical protein